MDCKREKEKREEKAITLIALVITIIVLLILAGVTISMLTGENGILGQANQAKIQTEIAEVKERAQIDITAWQAEQLKNNQDETLSNSIMKQILKGKDYVKEVKSNSFISTKGEYEIFYKDLNSLEENETVIDGVTIPKGFYYLEGDKKTGLVISDIENDTENIGNQFVFVPVDDLSQMHGTLANGEKAGKLYNFPTATTQTPLNWTEANGVMNVTNINGNREPDIVKDYDNNTSYNNGLFTKESLQEEFNKMIESVKQCNGFFIGRYELSLDSNKKAQSKKSETSSDASQTDTSMWYGLYAKAKTYVNVNNNNVKSSMIWGCQWDAMIRWMQANDIDVTSTTPIAEASGNTTRITGSVKSDKLNNIYDILGNSWEWTLDATDTERRMGRSGYYNYKDTPSRRNTDIAIRANSVSSSRFVLY